ncbi:MAG: hypothetical protein PHX93_04885 [Candidatus Peribacteraceae bacterium]|jgi:hypothetical protein|nr:hypothetical protein [Candidatus Peribacteraceae bacterium]
MRRSLYVVVGYVLVKAYMEIFPCHTLLCDLYPSIAAGLLGFLSVAILVGWSVFFLWKGERRRAGILLAILFFSVLWFHRSELHWKVFQWKSARTEEVWKKQGKDQEYISQSLGLSFLYPETDEYGDAVTVEESGSTVRLRVNGVVVSALRMLDKDPRSDLATYLTSRYGAQYPKCWVFERKDRYDRSFDVWSDDALTTFQIRQMGGIICPQMEIDLPGTNDFFLMDPAVPSRYLFLSLGDYPLKVHVLRQGSPEKYQYWNETIALR